MKSFLFLISLAPIVCFSQANCSDAGALLELNSTVSSYQNKSFLLTDSKTVSLTADGNYTMTLDINSSFNYAFILSAPKGVKATGIEIDDATGMQVQYDYKMTEGDNYIVASDFKPDFDGVYKIIFKVVPQSGSACAYIAVMKIDASEDTDEDDDAQKPKK